jgi:hypothetical protein
MSAKDLIPRRKFRDIAEANQYSSIRKQCMRLFDLARGKSPERQAAFHQVMVHQIAAVLGVEASERDLIVEPVLCEGRGTSSIKPNVEVFTTARGLAWRYRNLAAAS